MEKLYLVRLRHLLQSKKVIILSIIGLILYIGIFTKGIKYQSKYDINTSKLEGVIINYKIDGDKLSILLKGKEKVQVTYYIKSIEEQTKLKQELKYGIRMELEGILKIPSNNTIPNTFNYKEYLYNKKIYYTFIASKLKISKKDTSIFWTFKNIIRKRVDSFSLTKDYMYAFILGDNDYIDSNIYEAYKNNGITHLFAVSGMHVGLLTLALKKILNKLKIKDNKQDIVVSLFLMFYIFLVGFSASVLRSGLLFIMLIINKKSKLDLNILTVLYLLFYILLLINPFYIYDIGFIYSFITSLGLILFREKIKGNYVKQLFLISFIALMFSLPITIYNFYEWNLLSILNNILVVPLVSVVLFPLSLITFFLPFLEGILNLGFQVLEIINIFLDNIGINIIIGKISVVSILIYYVIVYVIYKKGFKYAVGLLLLGVCLFIRPYLDKASYVYYLDVGQGDSSLIVNKYLEDITLIDTGGIISYSKEEWQRRNSNFKKMDNLIVFFKSLGIKKIDTLILTHGDYDHMGEALDLVKNFKVAKVIFNNDSYNELEQELIKELRKKQIPYYRKVESLKVKEGKIYFLDNKIYDNENDNSKVIYWENAGFKFLFMGDAGTKKEEEILDKYNIGDITFLKVGHHGSKTSTSKEFVKKISPRYSIISVGANNRYGHPNEEVLANLKDSKIYRTDRDGSIGVKIKKRKLKIKTWKP